MELELYKKNKFNYSKLKIIQIGGVNLCVDDKSLLLAKNIGDIITFDYKGSTFTFIVKEKSNQFIKIVSAIEYLSKPILEISYDITDNSHIKGKLNFIRNSDVIDFKSRIDIFLCVSKYLKAHQIELDEDAKFYDDKNENAYAALIYRVFQKKESIYIYSQTGFTPKFTPEYTNDIYLSDIQALSESTFNMWMPFFEAAFIVSSYYIKFAAEVRSKIPEYGTKPLITYLNYLKENNKYELINCLLGSMLRRDIIKKVSDIGNFIPLFRKPFDIYTVCKVLVSTNYKCTVCE
jgi:hypothetical protein